MIKFKALMCLFPLMELASCMAEDYPTESYTLVNNLNELYTIEYTETSGMPDNGVDIEIRNFEKSIAYYDGGEYKHIEENKPQRIMFLCNTGEYELYFMSTNNTYEYFDLDCSSSEYTDFIIINGENDLGFKGDVANIRREWIDDVKHYKIEEYKMLAEDLQNNFTESELKEKFEKCGYDYTAIMYLYDLAS